mmetsp:Transcript_83309/g.146892  ORF Transcript_83309/g.146892 Transcript_83309/m.146892 type:complete len:201 (+) Transcript_83309:483-1085(+)
MEPGGEMGPRFQQEPPKVDLQPVACIWDAILLQPIGTLEGQVNIHQVVQDVLVVRFLVPDPFDALVPVEHELDGAWIAPQEVERSIGVVDVVVDGVVPAVVRLLRPHDLPYAVLPILGYFVLHCSLCEERVEVTEHDDVRVQPEHVESPGQDEPDHLDPCSADGRELVAAVLVPLPGGDPRDLHAAHIVGLELAMSFVVG